ncbi:MAG: GNAT family N-acetyltransferase [Candidatus Obscuribacterales bacterium]|jgi:predicted GNAT family N-acyltransferase|nr:GNAT family N-acetyltransferase [Candidatus Obscuribacterales bacterium]
MKTETSKGTLLIRCIPHNSAEYKETVALRNEILRRPLGLVFNAEDLERETDSTHIACYLNGSLAGCLILEPDPHGGLKMRQVAVSKEHQGCGIGKAMVQFSEQFARENNFTKIHMNARDTAVEFYLRLGYEIEGEPFEEVTIPHRHMFKDIQE